VACIFASDEEKKRFVRRCVSAGIRAVDGGNRSVTQQTLLGVGGLGHTASRRKLYLSAINARLTARDPACGTKTLQSDTLAAMGPPFPPGLVIVADVSDLVEADI
jgi:hypothetical protein